VVLTVGYGRLPWVALVLAFSFGSYGLCKKQAGAPAIESVTFAPPEGGGRVNVHDWPEGGKARSWLQAIADSMSAVLDKKVADMDQMSRSLDKQGSNKSVKASTDLQVAGQEFSYLMNASSTVIKTIGEGLSGMSRKQ